MVIDFHTHIFPDAIAARTIAALEQECDCKACTDGTLDGLLASMEESAIDTSIVLPVVTRPEQFKSVNRFAQQLNETYEKASGIPRIISFGGIHPAMENYKDGLKEIASMGLKGIKLHPDYQKMFFDDIRHMRLIDYASELGLIVSVHAGLDIGLPDPIHCMPAMARKLIDIVHPDKLVLAHFGGMECWDEVEQNLIGQDVYLDTAFMLGFIDQEQFKRMMSKHDVNKVLFATDSPWGGQAESISQLKQMNLEDEVNQKLLWKNATELLFEKRA